MIYCPETAHNSSQIFLKSSSTSITVFNNKKTVSIFFKTKPKKNLDKAKYCFQMILCF